MRLATVDADREQEHDAEHHPPERNDPAALIFEQTAKRAQLLQEIPPAVR